MEILSVKNLNFSYPKSEKKALCDISMNVEKGDIVLLCGETGSGKTTLLKMLKKEIAPFGELAGEIRFWGNSIEKAKSTDIGFVFQDPDSQIVCDKVWHELSFGLENIGIETKQMKRRVAEIASYFGISEWFYKNTSELSGGQKQLLNLASVTVMAPKLILLDEPLSQLDPIACVEFVNTLKRLNDDLGVTFIISEHRTQEIAPISNKLAVMKNGKMIAFGDMNNTLPKITDEAVFDNLPDCAKIWKSTGMQGNCPLTVKQGKDYLSKHFTFDNCEAKINEFDNKNENAIECKNISFRYDKNSNDILKNLSFSCKKGEIHSVLGANAVGKTTLVKVLSGILKAYKGKISIDKKSKVALLVQNVRNMFVEESIIEEFNLHCKNLGLSKQESQARIEEVSILLEIKELFERHPFDLSGGELQKCAIAKLLLTKPDIILMDEPVKSLDSKAKDSIKAIIKSLAKQGITIIMVTHDTEFSAEISDRCSLLFDGEIIACDIPQIFFSNNNFYTTGASRMSRDYIINAVTCQQVSSLCINKRGIESE